MRLRSLRHLVRAAGGLGQSKKIYVLGSSSLLAAFSDLGEGDGPLNTTFDADLLLDPIDKSIATLVSKAIGENTAFHMEMGYHADIVHPDITHTLPPGWEDRLIALNGFSDVFCLDPYDLAAVKIVVGREKDIALVRCLLRLGKITEEKLRERFQTMPLGEKELFKASRHFAAVLRHDP